MSSGQAGRRPVSEGPAGEPLASVPRRSLAWIADVVVVTVLVFAGVSLVDEAVGPAVTFRADAAALEETVAVDKGLVAVNAVVATALSAGYFVLPWTLAGGSPAQLALRVRVRKAAGAEPLSVGRALARWFLLFPPFATISALAAGVPIVAWLVWGGALVWYLVLLVTASVDARNQGLHDRIAGTVVRTTRAAAS